MVQPLERQFDSLFKTKRILTIRSSNHAPLYLPKGGENLCPHKNLHIDVYSSFIHNSQDMAATKMSSYSEQVNCDTFIQWNIIQKF